MRQQQLRLQMDSPSGIAGIVQWDNAALPLPAETLLTNRKKYIENKRTPLRIEKIKRTRQIAQKYIERDAFFDIL